MSLLPREEKFFIFFLNQVDLIQQATRILLDAVKAGNAHLQTAANEIAVLEQKGDKVMHEIYTRLNQTFITPLDPEDLHSLSSHLDDVLDGLEDASYRMVAYHLTEVPRPVIEMCEQINDCSAQLKLAFEALNKDQKLLDPCIEINRIEEKVDDIVRHAVKELFENEKDAIKLIKLKEVYDILEQTTDYCEDVADALQNVIVKNS
jgi:predicted phosphate transport protein (TIGR00153 family)